MAKIKVVVEGWVELPQTSKDIVENYDRLLDARGMVHQDLEDDAAAWLLEAFNIEKIYLHNYGSHDVIDMSGEYPTLRASE